MNTELSPRTLGLMVFVTAACVTPLEYPGYWFASLGSAAVGAPIAAGALGLGAVVVAFSFSQRWADGAGRLPPVYAALLAIVVLAGVGVNLSNYTRAAGAVQSVHFPLYYPAAFVSMGALLAAYFGSEGASRAVTVIFPLIATGMVALFAMASGNIDARNLIGPQATVSAPIDAFTVCSLGALRGFLTVLVWAPRVADTRAARGAALWGTAAATLVVVASVVWAQGIFGVVDAVTLRFPFVSALGTVFWQWLPASSLDAVVMVVWQMMAFAVVAIYVAMGSDLLRMAFRGLPHGIAFVLAASPAIAAGYELPTSVVAGAGAAFNAGVLVIAVLLPAALVMARRSVRSAA